MFEYLKMNMWKDGTEHCTAYSVFSLDDRGIWRGEAFCLVNNYRKNTYEIIHHNNSFTAYKVVAKGKEETLSLEEFKEWLIKNNVDDAYMNFLRENKWYCEKYPYAIGVKELIESEVTE